MRYSLFINPERNQCDSSSPPSPGVSIRFPLSAHASTYFVRVRGPAPFGKNIRPTRNVNINPVTRMIRITAINSALVAEIAFVPALSPCCFASKNARCAGNKYPFASIINPTVNAPRKTNTVHGTRPNRRPRG